MKYELKFGMLPFILIIAALTALLAYVGGLPENVNLTAFVGGIAGIVLSLGFFVWITWYLLFSPIPKAHQVYQASPLSPQLHVLMALLLLVVTASETLAAVWDETWHNLYGIPFGEDFFWRPHLLLYAGLLTSSAVAVFSGYLLFTRAKGTLQQRFRSDPILALLMIAGAFQVFGLSLDPMWHQLYGLDLTGLSLPHVFLGFIASFFAVCVSGLITPNLPKSDWQAIWKSQPIAYIAVGIVAVMMMTMLQPMTLDWVVVSVSDNVPAGNLILSRPDWTLPFIIAIIAAFCGSFVNHSLRIFGGATLSALLSFALRYFFVTLLGQTEPTIATWLIIIPAVLAMDAFYAWAIWRKETPKIWHSVLGCVLGMIVGAMPLMNMLLVAPKFNMETALPIVLAVTLASAVASFLGCGIGDYLAQLPKTEMPELKLNLQGGVVLAVLVLAIIGFAAWFIFTATPPIA